MNWNINCSIEIAGHFRKAKYWTNRKKKKKSRYYVVNMEEKDELEFQVECD